MENDTATKLEIGDFIRIPSWQTEGQVINLRPAAFGFGDGLNIAVEVLLEVVPGDQRPRWYRLNQNEYEVL